MLNTTYTSGTGVDGLALMGNMVVPFGRDVKTRKTK